MAELERIEDKCPSCGAGREDDRLTCSACGRAFPFLPQAPREKVHFSHVGQRYALGFGDQDLGLWDILKGGPPVSYAPKSDASWERLWSEFERLEAAETATEPVAMEASHYQSSQGEAISAWTAGPEPSKRSLGRRPLTIVVAIVLIVASFGGGAWATRSNVLQGMTGHLYKQSELDSGKSASYARGNSDGMATGYRQGYETGKADGRAAGYSAGYSDGRRRGCNEVFSSLGTTKVVSYWDWYFGHTFAFSVSSFSC
jgi:hypothetical protein